MCPKETAKHIVVCDDNEAILEIIAVALSDEGYLISRAKNGLEGIKLLETIHPDLVIFDFWMPELTGDEETKILKNNPQTSGIPVVIVSADKDIEQLALTAGSSDFISKPFDIDHLIATISKYA